MNLCSKGHDEICHEGRDCPCCEILKERDVEISALEDEVKSLQDEINDLSKG